MPRGKWFHVISVERQIEFTRMNSTRSHIDDKNGENVNGAYRLESSNVNIYHSQRSTSARHFLILLY